MRLLAPIIAVLMLLPGCSAAYYAEMDYSPEAPVLNVTPPPPIIEDIPPPPFAEAIWVAGYWGWTGYQYNWIQGRYLRPPRPGLYWYPGGYIRRSGGYLYVQGRWAPPGYRHHDSRRFIYPSYPSSPPPRGYHHRDPHFNPTPSRPYSPAPPPPAPYFRRSPAPPVRSSDSYIRRTSAPPVHSPAQYERPSTSTTISPPSPYVHRAPSPSIHPSGSSLRHPSTPAAPSTATPYFKHTTNPAAPPPPNSVPRQGIRRQLPKP